MGRPSAATEALGRGGGGVLRCFLMSDNVSGTCMSLWAFGQQLSGSQLSNSSATALNSDINLQFEEQWVVVRQPRNLMSMRPEFSPAAYPLLTYPLKT